ncbi:hypothetical protein P9436_21395 [Lysinibacillus capsici]|uniref:hypothetical protein n=1 Tax=Lysinibacillus capsici TaxID=2115968 RepID=UPI002E1DBE93|nr:hypothetical protein [Lysinibacillus capsici]
MGNKQWDNVIIVWSLYLLSPIILLFLIVILAKGLSIFVWYIELIQSITGFEDKSFLLIISLFIPPGIGLYLLYRLTFVMEKKLNDSKEKIEQDHQE